MKKIVTLCTLFSTNLALITPITANCPIVGTTKMPAKNADKKERLRDQLNDLKTVINNLMAYISSVDQENSFNGELQEFLGQVDQALNSLDSHCTQQELDNIAMVSEALEVQANTLKNLCHTFIAGDVRS